MNTRPAQISTGAQTAFTLVELLVVLAIISVIFGISAAAGYRMMAEAREHSLMMEKRLVSEAIVAYRDASPDRSPATIPSHPGPDAVRIDPNQPDIAPFAYLLQHPSKYYYTWSDGGRDLRVYRTTHLTSESY